MENQEIIKKAARAMCESLKRQGTVVSHSAMLEALAAGLGVDNWRKLKAVIDAPKSQGARVLTAVPQASTPNGVMQVWDVEALYLDNNQPYAEKAGARTALEAAYLTMVERLTDFGLRVGICTVENGDKSLGLYPYSVTEYELPALGEALSELLAKAQALSQLDTEDTELVKWLDDELTAEGRTKAEFNELLDHSIFENCINSDPQPIRPGHPLKPTEALLRLCSLVEDEAGGVVHLEATDEPLAIHLHTLRAVCEHFGEVLNSEDYGLIGDGEECHSEIASA